MITLISESEKGQDWPIGSPTRFRLVKPLDRQTLFPYSFAKQIYGKAAETKTATETTKTTFHLRE